VYCYVAGVPRLINTLLDAALADACMQKSQRPDSNLIRRTAEFLGWKPMTPPQAGADAGQKAAAGAAARPASARSSPPKVAIISAAAAAAERDRQRPAQASTAEKPVAAEARRPDLPPPSEMTLQLRRTADGDTAGTGRFAALSLANQPTSPTAAVFGAAETAARQSTPAPAIAMDATDTSATGMLRLQDLDERFAESIFGKDAEDGERKRD
jgi:hypothetical protein